MFSGLTSQVTNWMGKKTDEEVKVEDSEVGAESPVANDEVLSDSESKKESSGGGGGSRLIGSVKNQMSSVSSWLTKKEEPPPPSSPVAPPTPPPKEKEKEKEDDDSSATGGADSEAAGSEGSGSPIDETAGGQNFGAATTKALAGAKTFGSFLYSAVNKAGKTVSEASAKIKKTVEENIDSEETFLRARMAGAVGDNPHLENLRNPETLLPLSLLGEFNKEQEAFIKDKGSKGGGAPVPPWVGCPNQEALREECLALSTDRRNFVRAPPEGVEFSFDMEREFSICQAILQEDPNLEKMRFELVPKVISEENFWRNYLYRINLICQAAEVSNMAESAGQPSQDSAAAPGTSPPESSFVSEEFHASSEDYKEVREGMKKLGITTSDQENQEWEKELEAELQEYEMVGGDKSVGSGDLLDSDIEDLK